MQACWVRIEPGELQACFRACPGISEESGTCAEVPQNDVCRDVQTRRPSTAGNWALAAGVLLVVVVTAVGTATYKCQDCSLLDQDKH